MNSSRLKCLKKRLCSIYSTLTAPVVNWTIHHLPRQDAIAAPQNIPPFFFFLVTERTSQNRRRGYHWLLSKNWYKWCLSLIACYLSPTGPDASTLSSVKLEAVVLICSRVVSYCNIYSFLTTELPDNRNIVVVWAVIWLLYVGLLQLYMFGQQNLYRLKERLGMLLHNQPSCKQQVSNRSGSFLVSLQKL